ncbi:hypothetical protein KL930_004391 [Ogataea haglerorum]|uniref:Ornithine aminotransferase n=1 Tax=Ogataea haglerorum TaxID=1937702 RepID=A0AAN6D3P4_9ASCO|nr:uncharacterized protein KL911_004122 [Ogataea haglerorum]KAG7693042.1 hypothetical protein KL915_004498 [Ogataea haglerorum]KAG7704368.1 hypothetical protein KL914_004355 [Ogataea haglerorum]KAG7704554.1 hypothetical protein KL950_004361 [Ogataea haglerorum]KAG7715826.1 hypothetical protein KL913_003639 [Ogataea haglerorum]KAG7716610.1 hypothetical protein KL949_003901 [Ogataea haglerorum]
MKIEEFSLETQSLIKSFYEHSRGRFCPGKVPVARIKNGTVWDTDGNEYIEFLSFLTVVNMGHAHPKIMEAS